MKLPKIILKKHREQSVKRFHPWIFSGAIQFTPPGLSEGDLVEVCDDKGNFLAIGHYQPDSISVRILSFEKIAIDTSFFIQKIQSCLAYRSAFIDFKTTNVFRLVHGEGDGLPGLIIDYYNGLIVIQCHSAGMYQNLDSITESLLYVFKDEIKAIYNKSYQTLPPMYKKKKPDGFLYKSHSGFIEVNEHNHYFLVDFIEGQKTGFFIDQRENRKLVGSLTKGKSVANLFGYTGGFSVYAAKGGASRIITVDSSAKALLLARSNYERNGLSGIENIEMDVMDFFKTSTEKFDLIILDPPAFAKHHKHKEKALIAYKHINAKALNRINKGGLLFTFSCSQAISANELRQAVFVAAASENKNLRLVYQLHQPVDHPISIFHPEGEYLKGFVFQVE